MQPAVGQKSFSYGCANPAGRISGGFLPNAVKLKLVRERLRELGIEPGNEFEMGPWWAISVPDGSLRGMSMGVFAGRPYLNMGDGIMAIEREGRQK